MNPVDQMKCVRIENALAVHARLLEWCDGFEHGWNPIPAVTAAGYYVSLEIGSIGIWDSESGYHDELDHGDGLSFEGAVECYKNLVAQMRAWPK